MAVSLVVTGVISASVTMSVSVGVCVRVHVLVSVGVLVRVRVSVSVRVCVHVGANETVPPHADYTFLWNLHSSHSQQMQVIIARMQ